MPIRVRQAPEPFTKDAERQPPLFAPSDAYRRLLSELRRYVRREIGGRSFLISGHRGSGKTTLVLQAIWEIKRSAQLGELVPLLVRLQGPDLLPDPELLHPPKDAQEGTEKEPEDEPDEGAAESAEDGGGAEGAEEPDAPAAPPAGRASPQALAERALRQITISVYRAASQAFADAFARRMAEAAGTGDDLPDDQRAEFAARFRLALDEAPSPEVLRELYRLGGVLERGVFPAGGPDDARSQGMRELAALASAAAAFRMVSGKEVSSRQETRTAQEDRSRSFSLDSSTKDLVEKALAVLLGGGVGAAALTGGGESPVVAGLVGVGAALAAAGVFKFTGSRTRQRTASETYTFLPDRNASTLERELPVLIGRLADTGLAPVFVVDELDKVGGLRERMRTVVSQLKQFASERAFFCFLTDRDYFEHLRERSLREPYPHEHTYFTDHLFVLYRPADLHKYLDAVLEPGTDAEDETEKELLRFFLLHRSKMHPVDLRRELRRLSDADDYIALGRRPTRGTVGPAAGSGEVSFDLGRRFAVMLQLAIEWLVARDPLRGRLEQDPHFAQPVYDALYYLSRIWEKGGEEKGEQTDAGILDLSPKAFQRYLVERMNPNPRPPPGASSPGVTPKAENEALADIPLSPRDRGFLLEQVRELVSLLSEPERFKESLDVERLDYIPTSRARDAIPVEEVLCPLGDDRFAFQFDPYGRKLELPPGTVAQPLAERAAGEEGVGEEKAESETESMRGRTTGEEERRAEPVLTRMETSLDRPAAESASTDVGVHRGALQGTDQLIREIDRFVYDLVGMSLSTLASIHVLSAVPPWSHVEAATGRLRSFLDDAEPYPALREDAKTAVVFANQLKGRSKLLAASLVYGTALGSAVNSPHETERRTRGLTMLSKGLRFQDRRSPGALQRELERYRGTVSGVYEDHSDWPSLTDTDLAQWRKWVEAAVHSRTAPYDPNRVRLASESAWRSWKDRLEKRATTGRVEIEVTEADLLCDLAGAPPATELRLDLERMTLRDWSDAFLRGCGSIPKPPVVNPATNSQLHHQPRGWLAAAALIELGLGNRVESVLDSGLIFDSREVEEVRSWLRRVQLTRPRALEARQSAVLLSWGDNQPNSADWSPSGRFGAISVSVSERLQLLGILGALATLGAFQAVWMFEHPPSNHVKSLVEISVSIRKSRPLQIQGPMFHLVRDDKALEPIPQLAYAVVPITGAQSLDDAMEQALRYLNLPT
jgi:hypothetical protein